MTGREGRLNMLRELGVDVEKTLEGKRPDGVTAARRYAALVEAWRETEGRWVNVGDLMIDMIADRECTLMTLGNLLHAAVREGRATAEACDYAVRRKLRSLPKVKADEGRRAYIRAQIRMRKELDDLPPMTELEKAAAVLIRQETMIDLLKKGLLIWMRRQEGGDFYAED